MNMYTSVDLSALRGKKPFTGKSGGQAHLPDRWTILLGVSYLLGILLGTGPGKSSERNADHLFRASGCPDFPDLAAGCHFSILAGGSPAGLAVSVGILRSGTAIVPGGTAV